MTPISSSDIVRVLAGITAGCREPLPFPRSAQRICEALTPIADRVSCWVLDGSHRHMRPEAQAGDGIDVLVGSHARRSPPAWVPVRGAPAEALDAGQAIEMALFADRRGGAFGDRAFDPAADRPSDPATGSAGDPRDRGTGATTAARPPVSIPSPSLAADSDRIIGFGRYVPLRVRPHPHPTAPTVAAGADGERATRGVASARPIAVLALERHAGSPAFSVDDRVLIDAAAERLESLLTVQARQDDAALAEGRRIHEHDGVLLSRSVLDRFSAIAGDLLFRYRVGYGLEFVSDGIERVTGYAAREFLADENLVRRVIHPDDRSLLVDAAADPSRCEHPMVLRVLARDGTVSWQLLRLVPIADGHGRALAFEGLATDVTAMKRTEEALTRLASNDPLTGIPNRKTFHEFATRALARLSRHGGMVGVLFLDLDGFKTVNDTLGHAAGDQLLVRIAALLTRLVRREDVVARLGGDEFGVLLSEISSPVEATLTAQRILDALERPWEIDGRPAEISTGIGISVSASADILPEEMLRQADTVLYEAKRSGRGRWRMFESESARAPSAGGVGSRAGDAGRGGDGGPEGLPQPEHSAADRRPSEDETTVLLNPSTAQVAVSEARLGSAIDRGEIAVQFRPELDVGTGELSAVEAVMVWDHPEVGPLPGDAFLPMADRAGVTRRLAVLVARETAAAVARWRAASGSAAIAARMHVSTGQLRAPGIARELAQVVADSGASPQDIGIVLSEALIGSSDVQRRDAVAEILRAGFILGVDEFGRGRLTPNQLRAQPIATIALDPALVRAAVDADGAAAQAIALAVQLAESIGARVVATGVDTAEQLEVVRERRCHLVQGRLAGDLLTASALDAIARSGGHGPSRLARHPAPV